METHFTIDRLPVTEGRYLVYTRADDAKEYAKPLVLMWTGNDWYYPASSIRYAPTIFAWMGPLLFGKVVDLFPETPDRAPNPPQSTKYPEATKPRPADMRAPIDGAKHVYADLYEIEKPTPLEYDL